MPWRVWIEPKPSGKFQIRRRDNHGKNLPSKSCSTKYLANRLAKKWRDELEHRALGLTDPNKSLQEVYDEYLVEARKTLAENTVITIERILPKYLASKKIVADLSRQSIIDWRTALFKVNAQKTIQNHLRHLGAWLSWLVKQGYLEDSPFKNIGVPNPKPKSRHMHAHELTALDRKARGDLKLMFRIAYTTGMRQANTLALEGEWIQGDAFLVPDTKSGEAVAFPIDADRVAPFLKNKPKRGPLFPEWSRTKLRHHFDKLKAAARVRKAVTWHAAKHTFIKMALQSGLSRPEVQQLVGNKSSQSMDAYTVFEQSGLRARHKEIRFPSVGR